MSKDEIRAPLEELDIDLEIKYSFKKNCDLVITTAAEQKGRAKKIKVPFNDDKNRKFTLICESVQSQRTRPTTEEKIHTLDIAQEGKDYLVDELKTGGLKDYHVRDIVLSDKTGTLIKLEPKTQIETIKTIIKNKNETHQRNAEEIATQAIKLNIIDSKNVDEWYKAVIRLCKELCEKLDVNHDEVLKNLGLPRKKHLSKKIGEVVKLTSQLAKKL